MSLTKNIPHPEVNPFVQRALDLKDWVFLEEEALKHKGQWKHLFGDSNLPLDLEIGSGNGTFFNHYVRQNPDRNLLGMEIKYKPLVQTIRRISNEGFLNGRAARFHARYLDLVFEKSEINRVFIYFPDPWPRIRQHKNRLMTLNFFNMLFELQNPGNFVDIKTDDGDYFKFARKEVEKTPYEILRYTEDLHNSEWASENFITTFERIFITKKQPIYHMRLFRTSK